MTWTSLFQLGCRVNSQHAVLIDIFDGADERPETFVELQIFPTSSSESDWRFYHLAGSGKQALLRDPTPGRICSEHAG